MPVTPTSPPARRIPVACPVCDCTRAETRYEPWHEVADPAALYGAASGVRGTQRLVACLDCGMVYESPRFPEEVILEGYRASDEAGHDSQHPMRVKSFFGALERLRRRLPPPGARVLDVGTAGGAFLEAAARFGYEATGLEPSRFLVERGRKRGLRIEEGTIASHLFAPGSFDLVCYWDVLEHLVDPRASLAATRPLLKPGGTLLVNYPDIGTWQARLAGRRFWWILSVHLHHFSRATIRRICERTGFEAFHFQRYWQTLELGYLEEIAIRLRVPLARLLRRLTPGFLRRLPLPYYASQTTALARVRP